MREEKGEDGWDFFSFGFFHSIKVEIKYTKGGGSGVVNMLVWLTFSLKVDAVCSVCHGD